MSRHRRLLMFSALLLLLALAMPVQATVTPQNSLCDFYVDNIVAYDGDGSWAHPWKFIHAHIGSLVAGDTLCVRGDSAGPGRVYPVEQIYLHSNLVNSGTPGNPITLRTYPGDKVILRNVGGASVIYLKGADYWVIDGFVMDNNAHGRAIRIENGADHNVLRNNEVYSGWTDGIALCCGGNVGTVIENNHIHHFDAGDNDAHGIVLEPGSHDTLIRGNVIHDVSGDAVQVYATSSTPVADYSKNVQIVDNVMYRGTLPRSENALDLKGADGLAAIGNELYGYGSSAVVVQKGSRNLLFDGNLIHAAGFGIDIHGEAGLRPENIVLRNNVLYDITGRFAIAFSDVYNAAAYHNTIAHSAGYSFRIEGNGLHGGDIRNNLVYDSGGAEISSSAPFVGVTVGHNGWFKTATEFAAATDIFGSGDPGFVNAAGNDFHLTPGSPARDAGTGVGVALDFEGDPRPFGAQPDMGADEYWPSLRLSVIPRDGELYLTWTEYDDPALASYAITYTYAAGGGNANQGPSPIVGIPSTTHAYALTGLPNYTFYTLTLAARDGSGAELIASNSVQMMPTDIFHYLPLVFKN